MKALTIVGTRPEIIRLSQVLPELDRRMEHVLVHTGQNWDPQLSDVFFSDLQLRTPDHFLEVDTSSLGTVLGGILAGIESVLVEEQPDAMLVLGDTNSCVGALMAKRLGVPVFHMEAGNRCFDENVPEETNRRLIDHISDFNLCYTEHARRNLLAEGLPARRIFVTGSPLPEVLAANKDRIDSSGILDSLKLTRQGYLLVSMHREENVDNPENLKALLEGIASVQSTYRCRVVVSTHPRLRQRLDRFSLGLDSSTLEFLEPFGYLDFNKLQQNAICVLSDSGTISEESAILGFPAVSIRGAIERPEALDSGAMVLTGVRGDGIRRGVELVIEHWKEGQRPSIPAEYSWLDFSTRVVRLVAGLTGVHQKWLGLEPKLPMDQA